MKPIQFKTATLTIIILFLMFNSIASSAALNDTATFSITGSISYPSTPDPWLSYSSTPVVVDASVDGVALESGGSVQVVVGSSVSILAGEVQDYVFSNWFVNGVEYTDNPLAIDVTSDLDVVAVYTYQPPPSPPPPSTSEMIVGVNMWSGTSTTTLTSRDIPDHLSAGITHVRTGTGISSRLVDTLLANGISVVGTISQSGWNRYDTSTFASNVYNKVSSLAGKVEGWIVLNEANTNYYGFSGDPVEYTELLQVAYTQIKAADPNALVITTNILALEGSASGINFLTQMYANGAKGYFDVVGIDPYCNPAPPTYPNVDQFGHSFWNLPALHDVIVANGDNKPVWIIEVGWKTSGSSTNTPTEQATYLVQALDLANSWDWCERFYIYEWIDSTTSDAKLQGWGIATPTGTKPSYDTVSGWIATH